MKIFIISGVREASPEYRKMLEDYVKFLEQLGNVVHLPHRDTNQTKTVYNICRQNAEAIQDADAVHVFYNTKSKGTHFDMGVAFALEKPLVLVDYEDYEAGTPFVQMAFEWERHNRVQEIFDKYIGSNQEMGYLLITKEDVMNCIVEALKTKTKKNG